MATRLPVRSAMCLLMLLTLYCSHYIFTRHPTKAFNQMNNTGYNQHFCNDTGNVVKGQPSKILLVSYARSGSSLLGESIKQHENGFYWFEPLRGMYRHLFGVRNGTSSASYLGYRNATLRSPYQFENDAIATQLTNFLHCKLDELPVEILTDSFLAYAAARTKSLQNYLKCYLSTYITKHLFIQYFGGHCNEYIPKTYLLFNGTNVRDCYQKLHGPVRNAYNVSIKDDLEVVQHSSLQNRQICLKNISQRLQPCLPSLINACKNAAIRGTKLIRLHLETVRFVLRKDPSIKILWYIRDPRAVIESRLRVLYKKNIEFRTYIIRMEAKLLCAKLHADQKAFKQLIEIWPDNMLSLKYEDFVNYPAEHLKTIYKFIGKEVPENVVTFLYEATHCEKDGSKLETNRKNGTQTAISWKSKLTLDEIQIIQAECKEPIHSLDYEMIN